MESDQEYNRLQERMKLDRNQRIKQIVMVELMPVIGIGFYCYFLQSYFTTYLILVEIYLVNSMLEKFYRANQLKTVQAVDSQQFQIGLKKVERRDYRKRNQPYITIRLPVSYPTPLSTLPLRTLRSLPTQGFSLEKSAVRSGRNSKCTEQASTYSDPVLRDSAARLRVDYSQQ